MSHFVLTPFGELLQVFIGDAGNEPITEITDEILP